MGIVHVKESVAIEVNGGVSVLPRGQAWDSESDVVKANPSLFEAEESRVAGRPRVERATNAPGEKRRPGRPRKQAPKSDDSKG